VHYLREQNFTGANSSEEEPLGAALLYLAKQYVPRPSHTLNMGGVRDLTAAAETLDRGPDELGYFAFEDAHWNVLKKTVIQMMLDSTLALSAPIIEDILETATTEPPEPDMSEAAD